MTHAIALQTTNVPSVHSAGFTRRVTRKYTTSSSGVSLTAAAIPVSTPCGRRPVRWLRSSARNIARTMLTWPKLIPDSVGSIARVKATVTVATVAVWKRRAAKFSTQMSA